MFVKFFGECLIAARKFCGLFSAKIKPEFGEFAGELGVFFEEGVGYFMVPCGVVFEQVSEEFKGAQRACKAGSVRHVFFGEQAQAKVDAAVDVGIDCVDAFNGCHSFG